MVALSTCKAEYMVGALSSCLANEFAARTEVQGEQTNQVDD